MDHGNDVILLAVAVELPLRIAFAAAAASPLGAPQEDAIHEDDAWMIEIVAPPSDGGVVLTSSLVCPVVLPDAASAPMCRSYQLQFFSPACMDTCLLLRVRLCSGGLIRGEGCIPLRLQRRCCVCLDAPPPPSGSGSSSDPSTVLCFGSSVTVPVILRQHCAGVELASTPVLLRAPFTLTFMDAVEGAAARASVEAVTGVDGGEEASLQLKLAESMPSPALISAAVYESIPAATTASDASASGRAYDAHAMEIHLTCEGLNLDAAVAASTRHSAASVHAYTLLCALACGNGSLLTPLHVCGAIAVTRGPSGDETCVCEWGPTLKFAVTRTAHPSLAGTHIHVQSDTHVLWYMCESGAAATPRVVAFAYLRPFHADGLFRFQTAAPLGDVPFSHTRSGVELMSDAASVCGSDVTVNVALYVGTPALTPVDAHTHSHMFAHTPALTRVGGDVMNAPTDGLEAHVPPHLRLCTPHAGQAPQPWHVLNRAHMRVHLHVRTLARDVTVRTGGHVDLIASPATAVANAMRDASLPALVQSLMTGVPNVCASVEGFKSVTETVKECVRAFIRFESTSRSHTLALMEPFSPDTAAASAEVILQHALSGRGRSTGDAGVVSLLLLAQAISRIAPVTHIHAPVHAHVLEALYGRVTARVYTPGVVPPGVLASALTLLETVAHTAVALASTPSLMGVAHTRLCERLALACAAQVARIGSSVVTAATHANALFGVSRVPMDAPTDVLSISHAFADDPHSAVAATLTRVAALLCLILACSHARRDTPVPEDEHAVHSAAVAACTALRVCAAGLPHVHARVITDCVATVAAAIADASQCASLFDVFYAHVMLPLSVTDVGAALGVWVQRLQSHGAPPAAAPTLATHAHTLSRACTHVSAPGAAVCEALALRVRRVVAGAHTVLHAMSASSDTSFDILTARVYARELADAMMVPTVLSGGSSVTLSHLLAETVIAVTIAFDRLAQALKKRTAGADMMVDDARQRVAVCASLALALAAIVHASARGVVRALSSRSGGVEDNPASRACAASLLQAHTALCAWVFTRSHTHVCAGAAVATRVLDRFAASHAPSPHDNTLSHLFGVEIHATGVTTAPWALNEVLTCIRIGAGLEVLAGAPVHTTLSDIFIEAFRAVSAAIAFVVRVPGISTVDDCVAAWTSSSTLMHVDATPGVAATPAVQMGVCDTNGHALMALCAAATRLRICEVCQIAPWSPLRTAEAALSQLEQICTTVAPARAHSKGEERFPHTAVAHSAATFALCLSLDARAAAPARTVAQLLHGSCLRWSCEALGIHAGAPLPEGVAAYVTSALAQVLRMALDDARVRALTHTHAHVLAALRECIATCDRCVHRGVDPDEINLLIPLQPTGAASRDAVTVDALWAGVCECVRMHDVPRAMRAADVLIRTAGWSVALPHLRAHTLSRVDVNVDWCALTHAFSVSACLHAHGLDAVKAGDAAGIMNTLHGLISLGDSLAACVAACVCDGSGSSGSAFTVCEALLVYAHTQVLAPIAAALNRSGTHAPTVPRPDMKRAGTLRAHAPPPVLPAPTDERAHGVATAAARFANALCDATRFTHALLHAHADPFQAAAQDTFMTLQTTLARAKETEEPLARVHTCTETSLSLPTAFYRTLTSLAPTLTHAHGVVAPALPPVYFAVAHISEEDGEAGVRLSVRWHVLRAAADMSVDALVQSLRAANPAALVHAGDVHCTILAAQSEDGAAVWDIGTPHVGMYAVAGVGRTAAYARVCSVEENGAKRIVTVPPCRHNATPAHTLLVYAAAFGGTCVDGRTYVGSVTSTHPFPFPPQLQLHRVPHAMFHVWLARNATVTISSGGQPPHVTSRHALSSLGPCALNDKYRVSGPDPESLLCSTESSACVRVDIVIASCGDSQSHVGIAGVARVPIVWPTRTTLAACVKVVPCAPAAAAVQWADVNRSRLAHTLRWAHAVQVDAPLATQRLPVAVHAPRGVTLEQELTLNEYKAGAPLLAVAQPAGAAPSGQPEALDVATVIQRLQATSRGRSSIAAPVDLGVFGAGVGGHVRRSSDSLPNIGEVTTSGSSGRRVSVHMDALGLAVGRLYGVSEAAPDDSDDDEAQTSTPRVGGLTSPRGVQVQLPMDGGSVVSDAHTFKSEEELASLATGATPHHRRGSDTSMGAFGTGGRAGRVGRGGHALARVATFRSMAAHGRSEPQTPPVTGPPSPARPRMRRALTRGVSTAALALRDDSNAASVALPPPPEPSVWLHTPMRDPFMSTRRMQTEAVREKGDYKPSLDIAAIAAAETRAATSPAATYAHGSIGEQQASVAAAAAELDAFISGWPSLPDVPATRMAAYTALMDSIPRACNRAVTHAYACQVLFAALSDAVSPAASYPCGMRTARQLLVDYADIKALHAQLVVTEQKRTFLRDQRARADAGHDVSQEDMPPFADMLDRRPHALALACETGVVTLLHAALSAAHTHAELVAPDAPGEADTVPVYAQLQGGTITDAVNGLFAGEEM